MGFAYGGPKGDSATAELKVQVRDMCCHDGYILTHTLLR